jgi:hypothetical protein
MPSLQREHILIECCNQIAVFTRRVAVTLAQEAGCCRLCGRVPYACEQCLTTREKV